MSEKNNKVEIVQGWLHVWEIGREQEELLCSQVHRLQPKWKPKFCVFVTDKWTISFHDSEQIASPMWSSNYQIDSPTEEVTFANTKPDGKGSNVKHTRLDGEERNVIHTRLEGDKNVIHTRLDGEGTNVIYTRLDGGKGNFHRRWGYKIVKETTDVSEKLTEPCDTEDDLTSIESTSQAQTPIEEVHAIISDSCQTGVEEQRRYSLPVESTWTDSVISVAATFRLANFFMKKSSRNSLKSAASQERKSSGSSISEYETSLLSVKSSRSHESVLASPPGMHSIDLSVPNVQIMPLHSSVLGQGHCFHVATSQGSKYISCTTSEERDRWLNSLRRTIRPQDEHSRRSDSSLKIWIVEAKNVTPKRRYFCDILLDRTLYAKTSVKTMTDMLFWGEHFEFKNLPAVETITVNLYREADKKKKKEKNLLVGYISLSITELENRQLIEKWINCFSGTVGKTGKETKSELPIIRVKARRQTVDILPLEFYQSFIKYLRSDYKQLCQILEPVLAVREKEDLATCLVHILLKQGKACEFLSDIVMEEISRLDDEHLTFRGNSIATKATDAYMKLVGEKYLQDTLMDLIQQLVQSPDDCEVDPTKVATPQLLNCQQKNLDMYSNMAWVKVINSFCYFPNELREVFGSFRSRCNEQGKGDFSDNLISGCIFLRFLCPAILYPSLFKLTQEYPNERASRNLTLIAKTIQTLANFTQFGIKEEYMTFMNAFIEREAPNMKIFLQKISSRETNNQFLQFDGDIDLGMELSVLHALLLECIGKYSENIGKQFEDLNKILSSLTSAFSDPTAGQKKPNRQSHIYDNVICMPNQTKDVPQFPVNVNSNPEKIKNVLLSPTDILIDMLHHCGESTDDLPALANRGKSSSNSQLEINESNSTEITSSSLSTKKFTEVAEVRNVSAIEANKVYNEQAKRKPMMRTMSASDDVNGDYVDLIPFMDGTVHSLPLEKNSKSSKPLAFANPLFRHQQLLQRSRQVETHYGIPVNLAHTVHRVSSDSSNSSSDESGEDQPWQVMLAKTSSPLTSSISSDQDSSCRELKQLSQLQSFNSQDSFSDQSVSSISSSFSAYSSDLVHSASASFISPSSSMHNTSSATSFVSNGVLNSCGTFPRRRQGQQQQTNNYVSNSPFLTRDAKNGRGIYNSTPLSHRSPTFQRQISNPSHDIVQNTSHTSRSFPSRVEVTTNEAVHTQQANFHRVKSASHKIDQNVSIDHSSPKSSPVTKSAEHSRINDAVLFSYSTSAVNQKLDSSSYTRSRANFGINSSTSISTTANKSIGSAPLKMLVQKPPSSIKKSAGWQITHQMERSSSFQENSSSGDSSQNSLVLSANNSMSSMHESSSNSSTPSSQPWGYTPSYSDSNNSVSNMNKMQQRMAAHSDSSMSLAKLNASRISHTSSNSLSSVNCGNDNSPCQINSNIATRLCSVSDTQINTLNLQSDPLPRPPGFLVSKYALVHPNTTQLSHNLCSARAASYHSSQESTKSKSKKMWPFTTSHSLDLGYLSRQTDEAVKPACTESTSSVNCRVSAQSAVHSVLRKLQEQEKTKQEYEEEVHVLRQQLLEAQEKLQQTEMRLLDHDMDKHKLMDEWQFKLVESEVKMRKQQEEKDEQMKAVVLRLHTIENELKKEHAEMVSAVEHKQQIIEVQEQRILKLDQANKKLQQALADLNNRAADENSNSFSASDIFENIEIAGFN